MDECSLPVIATKAAIHTFTRRNRIFCLLVLISTTGLTSCSPEPPTVDPNSPEYGSAIKNLASCFLQQANAVDDQKSDAETIALAIEGTCTSEWDKVVALQLQGRAPYVQSLMLRDLQTNGEESSMAINAVLAERSKAN